MAVVRISKKSYQVEPSGGSKSPLIRFISSKLPVENRERTYLLAGAALLFVFASFQLLSSENESEIIERDGGVSARAYEGRGFQVAHTYTRANPSVPLLERIFCSGRRNSFFCSETNYHPYMVWWNKYAGLEDVDPNEIDAGFVEIQKTFARHEPYEKSSIILSNEDVTLERGNLR